MSQDPLTKLVWFGVTVSVFGLFVSWPTSVMLIATIFIHENGRLLTAYHKGLSAYGVVHSPFIGGIAFFRGYTFSRNDDFDIAMGGLSLSTLIVLFFYACFIVSGSAYFAELTQALIILNAIFLLPVGNFDGGRILKSLTFSIHSYVGFVYLALSVCLTFYVTNLYFFLFFLLFISLVDLKHLSLHPSDKRNMSILQWFTGVFKLSLVIFLLACIFNEVKPYEGSGAFKSSITNKDLLAD
jgi:Zn-dependent protease